LAALSVVLTLAASLVQAQQQPQQPPPQPPQPQQQPPPQFRYTPQSPVGVSQTQAVTASTLPAQPPFAFNPYLNSGGGFWPGPYGNVIQSPVSGYLQGAAALTTANAQYESIMQSARLQQQQVYSAKTDNRRRMFEEMQWEKANTPNVEDIREQERQLNLRRARNDPPNTEIWYGNALNVLLTNIQNERVTQGLRGPLVPLDPNVLRHINLTAGTSVGSVGVLRDAGTISWPRVLRQERFDKERAKIDAAAPKAVQYAAGGNDQALDDLTAGVKALKDKIKSLVVELSPDDYIGAMRFANQLSDSIQTLSQPMAVNFLNGKWAAQGNNVGELVDFLTKNGLKFAPATQGDETFYSSLYQSMRSYDAGISRVASR
jgi:hypothetical protein